MCNLHKIFNVSKNESGWRLSILGLKISHKRNKKNIKDLTDNNKVFVICDGEKVLSKNPLPGLDIQIEGNENVVELEYPIYKMKNCKMFISGNNNQIRIGCTKYLIENTVFDMRVIGNNRKINIGKNFSSNGAVIWNEENYSEINIGDDVMFGHNIFIRNSDGHLIFDKFGNHINRAEKIIIGNHVWVGAFVNILKNVVIQDGCVIGTGAIVTKSTDESNCIYAGIPAKKIKSEIMWERITPNLYYQSKERAFVNNEGLVNAK